MATEELIVRAVRAGGDRQDAHERIRRHSIAAARALKDGARANDLLDRLAADRRSASRSTICESALDPARFVGRAPRAGRRVPRRGRRAAAGRRDAATMPRARGGARMTRRRSSTPLPLQHLRRGKVREVYVVDDERLLLVATDRVSAFDVVMSERDAVQGRRAHADHRVVAAAARGRSCAHHMLRADVDEIIDAVPSLAAHRATLAGRAMLCRRTEVFPVECVVRGYSPARRGRSTARAGTLAGEPLPPGLRESDRFDPAALQPGDEGRDRARREHHRSPQWRRRSAPTSRDELERLSRLVYERGRDDRRGARHHHRRHEVRVRARSRRHDHADRRSADAGQLALLAGRAVRSRAGRSRASTSSRCATISTASGAPAAGTATRRRRRCRQTSSRRRARAISTRSAASPAAPLDLAELS